jgi:hypothetical protein
MVPKKNLIIKFALASLIVASTTMAFLHLKYSIYLFIFIIGTLFSFFALNGVSKVRLSFHILTGFLWGSSLIIFTSGLLALFGIPIRQWALLLPALVNLVMIAFADVDFTDLNKNLEFDEVFLFILVGLSLGSHVVSIRGFWAPILHDPISHATWAKQIFDTGLINYFYSPGLHILSALGMLTDGINVATYVLILTNIFNALVFIPIYFFLLFHFKNRVVATIGAVFFLIGSFPTALFLTSGKNALILGFSLMALMLAVFAIDLSRARRIILISVLLCAQILAHYPVAAIGFLLLASFLLLEKRWDQLISLGFGSVFGIFWGIKVFPFLLGEVENNLPVRTVPFSSNLSGIFIFLKSMFHESKAFLNTPKDNFIFIAGMIAICCTFFLSIKNKKIRPFSLAFVLSVFIAIVINTNRTSFFIYVALGICLGLFLEIVFHKIKLKSMYILFLLSTLIIASILSFKTYKSYRIGQTSLNMVSGNDISAFTWIAHNLEKDATILNNAAVNSNTPSYVFGSDGGTWIPVFSENKIAMPFTDFQSSKTHQIYDYYQKMLNNSISCTDFKFLISNKILYYYQDSQGVFASPLDGGIYPNNLEPVYSEEGIVIYRIENCRQQ